MDDLITAPEAMRRFGVSRDVIERLQRKGLLRVQKRVGVRAVLLCPADLEAALKLRRPVGRPRTPAPGAPPLPAV